MFASEASHLASPGLEDSQTVHNQRIDFGTVGEHAEGYSHRRPYDQSAAQYRQDRYAKQTLCQDGAATCLRGSLLPGLSRRSAGVVLGPR
ncbi:hypothetical protein Q3H58_001152 [Pseudomonas psychrotolerans]|nr:hypothetical protein [Pseudomonas psychrotolerans]